ncbi:MAG: creatininase family protein [Halodesulfurarchaeum sp.]
MNLAEVSWTDARDAGTDLALLPVGSTEQHGPHAPLGTDRFAAEVVAESAADAYPDDVVVAPAVPVGIAEEHRQFPGTLWVSPDTFRAYVRETMTALVSHGWNRIVVVNGHGGNGPAIGEVTASVTRTEDALAVPFTWFDEVEAAFDMGHAGPLETAIMLHTHPAFVHDDRRAEAAREAADRWGEWVGSTNLAHDSAEFTDNGVVGDPSKASPEMGADLLDSAVGALVDLLDAVSNRSLSRPRHK